MKAELLKLNLQKGDILIVKLPVKTDREVINNFRSVLEGIIDEMRLKDVQLLYDATLAEYKVIRLEEVK
jgi:hypothetical protein